MGNFGDHIGIRVGEFSEDTKMVSAVVIERNFYGDFCYWYFLQEVEFLPNAAVSFRRLNWSVYSQEVADIICRKVVRAFQRLDLI